MPIKSKAWKKIEDKRKQLTPEKQKQMIQAGGSIKTVNEIDSDQICREVRGKA
jgi:5-formyltetrahydrofolate cyclo-ligase